MAWYYWDPFDEMEKMKRWLDKMMQTFGRPFVKTDFLSFPVDISETDENIIVRAELPGFKKDEISLKATENSVEISAEHKEKKIERGERFYRAERRYGAYKRFLTLPVPVDYEKADAKLKDGVLTIVLPKKEKKKVGKKIKVK